MLGFEPVELPETQGRYAYDLLKKLKEVKILDEDEERFYNFLKNKYDDSKKSN